MTLACSAARLCAVVCLVLAFAVVPSHAVSWVKKKWWDPTASQAPVYRDAQFYNISNKLGFNGLAGSVVAFGDFNSDTLFVFSIHLTCCVTAISSIFFIVLCAARISLFWTTLESRSLSISGFLVCPQMFFFFFPCPSLSSHCPREQTLGSSTRPRRPLPASRSQQSTSPLFVFFLVPSQ